MRGCVSASGLGIDFLKFKSTKNLSLILAFDLQHSFPVWPVVMTLRKAKKVSKDRPY